MYYDHPPRRRSSPRRILILLLFIAAGLVVLNNQNSLRQQLLPQPTPTATRAARSYVVEAESLLEAGNVHAAIDAYIQAISLDPENIDVLIAMSRVMALYGRNEEALQRAKRAAQLAPQNVKAQAALAMAQDWYASWLQEHGRDAEATASYQQAITTARAAIALDKTYPEAYAYLAETYADLNDWPNASASIQSAIDIDPNRVDVQRALGYVRESQGNYSGAADAYEQAIKLSPNLAYLYIALGRNYRVIANLRDGSKYPLAIEAFTKATTIDPNYVTAFDELGSTYYSFEDLAQAQKALEKAIAIDPESWLAQFHLALTYYARRNYEDATTTFKTALALMNKTFDADHYCVTSTSSACERAAEAYTRLGLAYYYMDDSQCASDAIPAFQRALVVRPGNTGAQEGLRLCGDALKTSTPGSK